MSFTSDTPRLFFRDAHDFREPETSLVGIDVQRSKQARLDEFADCRLADVQNLSRFMCANQFVGRCREVFAVKRVDEFKERLKFIGYRLKFLRPADEFFQRVQIQCVQTKLTYNDCFCYT